MFKSHVRPQLHQLWPLRLLDQHVDITARADVSGDVLYPFYTQVGGQVRGPVLQAIEESYMNTLLQAESIC